jgi:hypothetical protein
MRNVLIQDVYVQPRVKRLNPLPDGAHQPSADGAHHPPA